MKKSFCLAILFIFSPLFVDASSDFSGFVWVGNNYGENGEISLPSVLAAKMQEKSLDEISSRLG